MLSDGLGDLLVFALALGDGRGLALGLFALELDPECVCVLLLFPGLGSALFLGRALLGFGFK